MADTANQRVRQIAADNTIHTIAGLGLTTPGTLTLTAPSVIAYGTGQLIATLATTTSATGPITFLDTFNTTTTTIGTGALTADAANLSAGTLTAVTATLATSTLPAGHHSIIATYAGDLTHSSAQSSALAITIAPQQLTATITPARLLYGQSVPTLTATLTGLLPQDASNLSATFTTSATTLSPAGTYPITATLTGPAAGNYTLTASPVEPHHRPRPNPNHPHRLYKHHRPRPSPHPHHSRSQHHRRSPHRHHLPPRRRHHPLHRKRPCHRRRRLHHQLSRSWRPHPHHSLLW